MVATQETLAETLERVRKLTAEDLSQGTFSALLVGPKGSGKTRLLGTARGPVLVHSFDPGGSKTLLPEIEAGHVIVDSRFEHPDPDGIGRWARWEEEFHFLRQNGTFEQIGTYCVDSLSLMTDSIIRAVIRDRSTTTSRVRKTSACR